MLTATKFIELESALMRSVSKERKSTCTCSRGCHFACGIQDYYHFCYNDDHSNIAIIILITKRERERR